MAISAVSSYAGFAVSATTLVYSMLSGCDDQQNGETVIRQWEYSPDKTDVGHFFWWRVNVDPGQTIKFDVEDDLFGPYYELVGVGWHFTVTAPPSPDKMTDSEKERYGVELVSADELRNNSQDLKISSKTINSLINSGEPVYRIHNLSVEAVPYTPNKENAISKLLGMTDLTIDKLFNQKINFASKI